MFEPKLFGALFDGVLQRHNSSVIRNEKILQKWENEDFYYQEFYQPFYACYVL